MAGGPNDGANATQTPTETMVARSEAFRLAVRLLDETGTRDIAELDDVTNLAQWLGEYF